MKKKRVTKAKAVRTLPAKKLTAIQAKGVKGGCKTDKGNLSGKGVFLV